MAAGKPVRVSRTLALFTRGLGCVLREHLHLVITTHEHWEFTLAEKKVECSIPGKCSWHGISDEFHAELVESHGTGPWPDRDRHYTGACHETRQRTYHVTGQAGVQGNTIELRAVLTERHTDPLGYLFDVTLWVQNHDGMTTTCTLALSEDCHPFNWASQTPSDPPEAITFAKPSGARA